MSLHIHRQVYLSKQSPKPRRRKIGVGGYTIVESLIFLAISGALFVIIFGTFSGRQQRAEFQYGVQEFVQQLQGIANDVATGNFEYPGDISCTVSSGSGDINIVSGGEQGKSKDCILIGRVLQLAPGDSATGLKGGESTFRTHTMVGRRIVHGSTDRRQVSNIAEASPRMLGEFSAASSAHHNDPTPYGLIIKSLKRVSNSASIGAVAFVTDFAEGGGAPGMSSSARQSRIMVIDSTYLGQSPEAQFVQLTDPDSYIEDGAIICAQSASGGYYAEIILGGDMGRLNADIDIQRGSCP